VRTLVPNSFPHFALYVNHQDKAKECVRSSLLPLRFLRICLPHKIVERIRHAPPDSIASPHFLLVNHAIEDIINLLRPTPLLLVLRAIQERMGRTKE